MRLGPARRAHPPRDGGFTVIELLAVVLILGLVASLVAPPLGLRTGRSVEDAAEQLSASCELARQRAVMTGRTHQLVLDLDGNRHHVEWQPPPEVEPTGSAELAASDPRSVALAPPSHAAGDFVRLPGALGRDTWLGEEALLLAVDLPDGQVDQGALALRFESDGTADPAWIWLGDARGHARRVLEVRPLADAVVVRDAEA